MGAFGGILISVLAVTVAVLLVMYIIVPAFKGLGWLIRHIAQFVGGVIGDVLRAIGALIVIPIYSIAVLGSIVIGRWSAAGHFGRSIQDEFATIARSVYNVAIGRPARLLMLRPLVEGLEQRVPQAFAGAPGPDKPTRRAGQFEGYRIVGSLKGGGSGARLYIAEPDERRLAAFDRAGHPGVERVVIKAFSMSEGSSLPQIIRESRALEAARDLGLILDHGMTEARFFYVMPYVPGDDLNVVTRKLHERSGGAGLDDESLREAIGYVVDLLATLDRYHRGGLWHKDVKPDNIIIHDGQAHLVDLGLVTPLRSAMTLTTHGTEYFRDPEMVRMALKGVKVHQVDGAKFDIFAAGAVLYSIVENSFPMHGGLSQVTKRCPEGLRWVIRRAMTDYNNRYASASAMLRDLKATLASGDLFAVRPADLPSVKDGDAPAMPEPEAPAVAARVVPAEAPTEHVAVAPPPAAEAAAEPAPRQAKRSPRIRVKNWWTGGFSVDDGPAQRAPDSRGADKSRTRFTAGLIFAARPRKNSRSPGEEGRRTARVGAPVPPRSAPRIGDTLRATVQRVSQGFEDVIKTTAQQASQQAREHAGPFARTANPPRRRSVTPRDARLPAAEQLRRARQRAHAAQTRVRERFQHRARSRPRHVNGGVVGALVVAALLFVGVAAVVDRHGGFLKRSTSGLRISVDPGDPDYRNALIRIDGDQVKRSIGRIGDDIEAFLVDLRTGIIEPAVQGVQATAESAVDVPAPKSSAGRWLVLSDIGPGADEKTQRLVERAMGVLAYRGWSLIGLEDNERDVDLTASARNAIGLEVSEAPQRLAEWLSQQGEALSGVLWLTPDDSPLGVRSVVVHRRDTQPAPIEQALRAGG